MFEYKIVKEDDNLEKVLIEKSNISHTFTLGEINEEQFALKKYIKEFTGNRDYKKSVMENVALHHEYVTKFTDEELFTISMYHEAKDKVKQYEEKIAEFTEQLAKSEAEVLEIIKQIGVTPKQIATLPEDNKNEDGEDK